MRILIDIGHPAHVHFFKNAIKILKNKGHDIIVTSRDKEFALDLLDALKLNHYPLSSLNKGGLFSLGIELIKRNIALYKIVRQHRPDIMTAIGGVSIAQVGKLTRIPSLVFYDTENAKLQNAITYPFASCVFAPRCYEAWLPKKRHVRYDGYHELSYLHPNQFKPDKKIAVDAGLDPTRDNFLLRFVSWQANHDIGEKGFTAQLMTQLVKKLAAIGHVMISSESELPDSCQQYRYSGAIEQVHHVMAFCKLHAGESATMASESAVLGIPAMYIANTGRGYTNEQEKTYQLVSNITELTWENIEPVLEKMLQTSQATWQSRKQQLLNNTIDVTQYIVDSIQSWPECLNQYQHDLHKAKKV
ncbi:hypothetical protein MNBD_GAMMA12-1704 [hydrothermal vent metagenome]|uniref:DUF354 domain-containing protein n=1 Tax=hydrothermal vent metagenome TaxID=652676 RepID=A0A3B0Y630_9ZZZZ